MTTKKFVADFLEYLQIEKSLSHHTVSNYQRHLNKLLDHLAEQKIADWQAVTPYHLIQFIAQLHKQGLSAKSLAVIMSSCRSFFTYLLKQNIVTQNPAASVMTPKGEKALPKVLSVDEVSGFLNHMQPKTPIEFRDLAIMELFYSSGIRLSELTQLDLQDVKLQEASMEVKGKGNKMRITPIGGKAIKALQGWLAVRGQLLKAGHEACQAVFISQRGVRISNRSVQQRLSYWGKKLGCASKVYPHKFRHSCASHILESSSDLRAVQELLGHANLSTTQVYTHLDFQHLAKVYDQAHPRAKKSNTK